MILIVEVIYVIFIEYFILYEKNSTQVHLGNWYSNHEHFQQQTSKCSETCSKWKMCIFGENVFVIHLRNKCHFIWLWGNDSECGTNKTRELRCRSRAFCLFCNPSHSPWTQKKGTHSFYLQIFKQGQLIINLLINNLIKPMTSCTQPIPEKYRSYWRVSRLRHLKQPLIWFE